MHKYFAIFRTGIIETLQYRASAFIWGLTDLIPPMAMFFYWLKAFESTDLIFGKTQNEIVSYYLITGLVVGLIVSHPEYNISTEINRGDLTNFLLKPFNFIKFQFINEIAYKLIRFLITLPVFIFYFLWVNSVNKIGLKVDTNVSTILILLLSYFLIYLIKVIIGMLAFYSTQIGWLIGLDELATYFFSGIIIPLYLFPHWAQNLSNILPFKFYAFVPIQALLGFYSYSEKFNLILTQLIWILVFYFLAKFLWRKGIRKYTGYGN